MKKSIGYSTGTMMMLVSMLAISCMDADDDFDDSQLRRSESEVIVDNLLSAGFPASEIGVSAEGTVFVGNDAVVSLQASRELAGITNDFESIPGVDDEFRQYRTNNTVNTATVHVVCINPSAAFNSNALMLSALDTAIARYNAQGLMFSMQRNGNNCDANIAAKVDNSGGGVSGFPANGLPYNELTVDGNLAANYGSGVATHVIMHELGHTIGFRHTDYFDRSISCGGAHTNEGDGGVGALLIPGTPAGAVLNGSVMNSCFSGNSTGTWTGDDVTALDCLYDTGACAPEPPPEYVNFETQANLTAAANSEVQYGPYTFTGDAFRVQISGGSGDADLYVREGSAPSANTYDCRPYVSGNTETCEFNPGVDGDYYVMVRAYAAYSGLTMAVDAVGDVQLPGGNPPPPPNQCGDNVCDDTESCDGRYGTSSCISDCPGKTGGKPKSRFCYIGDVCEGPGCP